MVDDQLRNNSRGRRRLVTGKLISQTLQLAIHMKDKKLLRQAGSWSELSGVAADDSFFEAVLRPKFESGDLKFCFDILPLW